MGVALQAFMLLLVYLPGGVFVFGLTGEASNNKELPTISSAGMTGWTVLAFLAAVFLHLVAGALITLSATVLPYESSATAFVQLLIAVPQNADYITLRDRFATSLPTFAVYMLSLCIIALFAGRLGYKWINDWGLDRRVLWLRFHPRWHYILSGKNSDVRNLDDLAIRVYAVVELDKRPVVYSGLLSNYWFDEKTGVLDVIVLDEATRSAFPALPSDKKKAEPQWMRALELLRDLLQHRQPLADPTCEADEVELGDNLTIKYSEIKNLNVQYIVAPGAQRFAS